MVKASVVVRSQKKKVSVAKASAAVKAAKSPRVKASAAKVSAAVPKSRAQDPQGAGLGLRRALMGPLLSMEDDAVDFLELAPDNWIGVGGRYREGLDALAERFRFVMHGLSLDIGGPDPLDMRLLDNVATLMDRYNITLYS